MRSHHLGLLATLVAAALLLGSISFGILPLPGRSRSYEAEDGGEESDFPEGQDNPGAMESESEDMDTVFRSDFVDFGYRSITYLAIQTQEEWETLWEPTGQDPPTVNFEANTVLVALLGQMPSAGHSVGIVAVNRSQAGVVAFVEATAPGAGCLVATVLTYPVHMVEIPKAEGPFTFELKLLTHHCGD